ncbi:MAG: two-component regulator propeller domain-containing protein [Flavicella sp.]
MKGVFSFLLFVFHLNLFSQAIDYSRWSDVFSYQNVEEFLINNDQIYARTDNALFLYNLEEDVYEKISVSSELSTQRSTAIAYNDALNILCVGFENGLLQLVDEDLNVSSVYDITLSEVSLDKTINSMYIEGDLLYISMTFGIVIYDISKNEFQDTFYIGPNSSEVNVNSIVINEGIIYAASDNGIYTANINSNLLDINNWGLTIQGAYSGLKMFDGAVVAFKEKSIYKIEGQSTSILQKSIDKTIVSISVNGNHVNVASETKGYVFDTTYQLISSISGSKISFVASNTSHIFASTDGRGILKAPFSASTSIEEIHPNGPVSNEIHSITEKEGHIWCVYGGFNSNENPLGRKLPISHFDGDTWNTIPYSSFGAKDIIDVVFDPLNNDKVYVNSYTYGYGPVGSRDAGGILVLENEEVVDFWHSGNTTLGSYRSTSSSYSHTLQFGPAIDPSQNLWFVSSKTLDEEAADLKKRSANGEWSSFYLSNSGAIYRDIICDDTGTVFIGSKNHGLHVFKEETSEPKTVKLTNIVGQGDLPSLQVNTIAVDSNQKVWIGTASGLVTFDDVTNVFSGAFKDTEKVSIVENGLVTNLLDAANITDIYIDGADNKWIGTLSNGVYLVNAQSNKVLNIFNKDNSPLPTNNIVKITQNSDGITYILTTKGLLTYDSKILSYGSVLDEVYGYPNPVLKQHHEVTIVGKDGAFLPENTKLDIFDAAGNLVFTANTSQSSFGGKIVWDKKNLNGVPVASGVYMVLLYDTNGNQTSSTKLAIVN